MVNLIFLALSAIGVLLLLFCCVYTIFDQFVIPYLNKIKVKFGKRLL